MFLRFFSFWFFPAAAVCLTAFAALQAKGSFIPFLAAGILAGILLWTLLEYLVHRFLFHGHSNSRRFRRLRQRIHLHHHGDPRNPDRILVRPQYSLSVSAIFLGAVAALSGDGSITAGLMTGLWAGFLYYEWVHYRVHMSSSTGVLLRFHRRRHFHHHFVNEAECFGVTSPLWDIIFRSHRKAVPARQK